MNEFCSHFMRLPENIWSLDNVYSKAGYYRSTCLYWVIGRPLSMYYCSVRVLISGLPFGSFVTLDKLFYLSLVKYTS